MQLNHVSNRLNSVHFETIVEMLKSQLGFVELRRSKRSIWLRQPGANVDLQFVRSETINRDADKRYSQISFLSEMPKDSLENLAQWLRTKGLAASVGSYSNKEFYLDAPEVFVDFIIEAMLPELAEYNITADSD